MSRCKSGFSLIQISVLLTVATVALVTLLPSARNTAGNNASSATKMNQILSALRQYQVTTCSMPCPADPLLATGAHNYGIAATNTGIGTGKNCVTGGIYADTTQHIAIGMVPVSTLGLPYDYALDAWGRDITYAVDTGATGSWAPSSSVTISDYSVTQNSITALVSHGRDGYGAWLPLASPSGTASRLDNGSTDNNQADNAQVAHSGGLNQNSTFQSFVNQLPSSTFDDEVVYKSPLWNINNMPVINQATITPPSNGGYTTGQVLTFTITLPHAVTVTGTPQLDLSALGTGSIGTSNVAYATYNSGLSTPTSLVFTYTVQANDSAPISGISMISGIDLNGGTVTPCVTFAIPSLSGVLIFPTYIYATDSYYNRVVVLKTDGSFVRQIGCASGHCSASSTLGAFNNPQKAVVDSNNNLWVSDYGNSRIEEFDSNGNYKGKLTAYTGSNPTAMTIDTSGNMWVISTTDAYADKFNSGGGYVGHFALTAGSSTCGKFNSTYGPEYIATDTSGNIWMTDYSAYWLQEFSVTSPYSSVKCVGGTSSGSGSGQFKSAHGVVIDSSNNVYVADPLNHRINKFNNAGGVVNSFSGGTLPYLTNAALSGPYDLYVDSSSNIWIYDAANNNIQEYTGTGTLQRTISSFNGGDTFGVNGGNGIGVTGLVVGR